MAISKPTVTRDVVAETDVAAQSQVHGDTVSPPTLTESVATIERLSDPGMLAKVDEPGYVKVTSPTGAKTTVPEGIADELVRSGYTKSK